MIYIANLVGNRGYRCESFLKRGLEKNYERVYKGIPKPSDYKNIILIIIRQKNVSIDEIACSFIDKPLKLLIDIVIEPSLFIRALSNIQILCIRYLPYMLLKYVDIDSSIYLNTSYWNDVKNAYKAIRSSDSIEDIKGILELIEYYH